MPSFEPILVPMSCELRALFFGGTAPLVLRECYRGRSHGKCRSSACNTSSGARRAITSAER
jgi:hypothetical protein